MKRFWVIIAVFFLVSFLSAQHVRTYSTKDLVGNTAVWTDSVRIGSGDAYYSLYSTSAADTITTNIIYITGGGGDIEVSGYVDGLSGTMNVLLEFGEYLSPAYGFAWTTISTLTTDGKFRLRLTTSDNHVTGSYAIRMTETGAQRNKYSWFMNHYNW